MSTRLDLATELAIAPALKAAHNEFAASHVNAACANLIAAVVKHGAPAFGMHPAPDEYDNAAETLRALARAFDDIIYSVAVEAADNARTKINRLEYLSIASDALNDSGLLSDLADEAEDLRETEMEDVS